MNPVCVQTKRFLLVILRVEDLLLDFVRDCSQAPRVRRRLREIAEFRIVPHQLLGEQVDRIEDVAEDDLGVRVGSGIDDVAFFRFRQNLC